MLYGVNQKPYKRALFSEIEGIIAAVLGFGNSVLD